MSKKTALLVFKRPEVERAVERLIDTSRMYAWDTPEGRYRRLLVEMGLVYLGTMDLWAKPRRPKPKAKRLEWTPMPAPPKPKTFKPKKPKSHRILKDAGNEVLKAVGKAWSPGSKRKPKPKAKRRTAR